MVKGTDSLSLMSLIHFDSKNTYIGFYITLFNFQAVDLSFFYISGQN